MELQDICEFLSSLPSLIDSFDVNETRRFSRRFQSSTVFDDDKHFLEAFDHFCQSLRSIACSDGHDEKKNIVISMQRIFTRKEVVSRRVSRHMKTFVFALGFHLLGCCHPIGLATPGGVKNKIEAILLLEYAFRQTLPPIRSLQDLSCDATAKSSDAYYLNYLHDNPSFCTLMEEDFSKSCTTKFPVDHGVSDQFHHPASHTVTEVMSYVLTTCLAQLEDSIVVTHKNWSHHIDCAVLFHPQRLQQVNRPLMGVLLKCFLDMAGNYPRIFSSLYRCDMFFGIVFQSPRDSYNNRELLSELDSAVIEMKETSLGGCRCRKCQEMRAIRFACFRFLLHEFHTFLS